MTRMECGQSVTDIIERGMVSVARSFRCMNFLLLGNELVSVLDGERSSTIHVEPEVWTEGSFTGLPGTPAMLCVTERFSHRVLWFAFVLTVLTKKCVLVRVVYAANLYQTNFELSSVLSCSDHSLGLESTVNLVFFLRVRRQLCCPWRGRTRGKFPCWKRLQSAFGNAV